MNIFEQVKKILCDQLDLDEVQVTEDSEVIDDLDADSLDILDLLMTLEQAFDTEIPDEDLNLWLKADEGVELGQDGRISVWKDNSGNGNNATIAQNPQAGENLT